MKIFNVLYSWYKYQLNLKHSGRKIFCSIKNTNVFIRSFVNLFADISLTFFDSSFTSFLFDVTSVKWLSKSVLFKKLAISFLLAKFACLSLALKLVDVSLLNSGVVIYLS